MVVDGVVIVVPEDDGDREEGEIVDEFEMIMSSEDEEFKLRARIQQLEENNKEVERMEMMLSTNLATSTQYNYEKPFGRYNSQHIAPVQVLSDVSSQSDSEYESQRKYCKHKIKRMDSKRHEGPARSFSSVSGTVVGGGSVNYRRHWPYVPRRSKLKPHVKQQRRPKQTYNHHKSNYYPHHQDNISVDSMDEDDEVYEYDCNDGDEDGDDDTLARINRLKLSRKKLRVALAREGTNELMGGQYKHSLKERLLGRRREKSPSPIPLSSRHRNKEFKHESEMQLPELAQEADDDEGVARSTNSDNNNHEHPNEDPAELKLRLIALKSAILKKHLARKKRDAERAYSPTDMINRVHPTISNDCDIDDLMEISPAASPERVPSPVPPPPQIDFEQTVDTKPVDMDLVETDSDDQRRMDSWNPWPNNYNSMHAAGGSFRCFMPSIPVPNVSVPIVIDDNEDGDVEDELAYHHRHHKRKVRLQSYDDDEVAPPPPPFNIPHMQIVDMDDDNDNARDGLNVVEDSFTDIQSISMDNSQTRQSFQSTDDEAGELRAMLLSNLKPSKETQQPQPVPAPVPASVSATVPASLPSPEVVTNDHDSDDPEALRSLLLSSIASKKKTTVIYQHREVLSPNERLKNAVKRFQEVPLPALVPSVPVVPMPVPPHPSIVNVPPEATETTSEISQEVVPVISLDIPPEISPDLPSEVPSEIPLGTPSEIPPEIPLEIPSETPAAKIPQNIIKIVKPNKVINKKTAIKRKMVTEEAVTRPSTLLVKETSSPLLGHSSSGGSSMATTARLITTVEPGSIKVKKLIISLGESSAGSDDELELSSCYASYATTYTDNASPLSLAMGSNSASTTRSNTPNSEILEQSQSNNSNPNLRRTVINEYFEKKLDDFLKQARSKVPTGAMPIAESAEKEQQQVLEKVVKLKAANGIASSATVSSAGTQTKPKTTPGAVRHLPVASQKEYLRLIERMRLLEKRKATIETNNSTATEKTTASTTSSPKGDPKSNGIVAAATAAVEPSKSAVEPPSTSKAGLTTQQAKESRLKAFENSFNKIGGSMITNLEKSMQMVAEAKQSKITRLRCAHRLKELHAEMQAVKLSVKQEEAKLARIQPEIQASHEIIISLKLKRNKLYNAAMELGKGLRGDDYRLKDEDKPTIVKKSSTLSKEIRLYNSIVKYDDLDQLIQHENKAGQSEQMDNDNNEQTVEMANETEPLPSSSPIQSIETTQITTATTTTAAASRLDNQPQEQKEDQKEEQQQEPEPESVPEPIVPPINEEMVDIQKPPVTTPRFMRELREDDEKDVDEKPFESKYLTEYRTPMSRNYNSQLDVNATICPFDLMGRCEDGDCPYLHLSQVEGTATPDP